MSRYKFLGQGVFGCALLTDDTKKVLKVGIFEDLKEEYENIKQLSKYYDPNDKFYIDPNEVELYITDLDEISDNLHECTNLLKQIEDKTTEKTITDDQISETITVKNYPDLGILEMPFVPGYRLYEYIIKFRIDDYYVYARNKENYKIEFENNKIKERITYDQWIKLCFSFVHFYDNISKLHNVDIYHCDLHGNNILYDEKSVEMYMIDLGLLNTCSKDEKQKDEDLLMHSFCRILKIGLANPIIFKLLYENSIYLKDDQLFDINYFMKQEMSKEFRMTDFYRYNESKAISTFYRLYFYFKDGNFSLGDIIKRKRKNM